MRGAAGGHESAGDAAGRVYLDVPYAEKDTAKRLGARWDPTTRRWYAQATGQSGAAFTHLCVVNGWQPDETDAHIAAAFRVWQDRFAHEWSLDCSILTAVGINPTPPPPPAQRRTLAEDALTQYPTSR